MMKMYIGGAWIEREERAMKFMRIVEKMGYQITHDWTIEETPNTWSTEENSDNLVPKEHRLRLAMQDMLGVKNANIVWILAPHGRGSAGLWTEFGIAVAHRYKWTGEKINEANKIIVSGANCRRTIFTELADELFENDLDALDYLVKKNVSRP